MKNDPCNAEWRSDADLELYGLEVDVEGAVPERCKVVVSDATPEGSLLLGERAWDPESVEFSRILWLAKWSCWSRSKKS